MPVQEMANIRAKIIGTYPPLNVKDDGKLKSELLNVFGLESPAPPVPPEPPLLTGPELGAEEAELLATVETTSTGTVVSTPLGCVDTDSEMDVITCPAVG